MKKTNLTFLVTLIIFSLNAQLPSTFDLRNVNNQNFVTSVKSQQGGTCWTHGTMASIEGNLMITGNWESSGETGEPDLAEYHLDWWNGFNEHFNNDLEFPFNNGSGLEVHYGGDYRVSTAYMARLEGAVREIDGHSFDIPPDHYNKSNHIYYPKDVEWLTAGSDLENIDLIKSIIMKHGVLATCLTSSGAFINNEYEHYQPPTNNLDPNHSVAIIGWDDNRVTHAPKIGAWLVKNSWGSSWGYGGYFWISYYDKHATQHPEMGAISFYNVNILEYDSVYYHDYHGWRDTLNIANEAYNSFIANKDENIVAGSFFTAAHNVDFEYKIFDDFDGDSLTNLLYSQNGNIPYSGFHTIDFNKNITIDKNDDFYIYLKLSNGGMPYDRTSIIPVLLSGYSNTDLVTSTANPGESFYRNQDNDWIDFYNYDDPSGHLNSGNFCIKAITGNYDINNTIENNPYLNIGIKNSFPNPFINKTTISYSIDQKANIQLIIMNLYGVTIDKLVDNVITSGKYNVDWDANKVNSGMYIAVLKINGESVSTKKLIKQ